MVEKHVGCLYEKWNICNYFYDKHDLTTTGNVRFLAKFITETGGPPPFLYYADSLFYADTDNTYKLWVMSMMSTVFLDDSGITYS